MQDGVTTRAVGKHTARFILVGLYTGTRHAAICGAAFQPAIGRGYGDLERGVFYRRGAGARETKKRQPPVRIPDRLLAHMRRWRRLGIANHAVVEWNGQAVRSVRKGLIPLKNTAVQRYGSRQSRFEALRESTLLRARPFARAMTRYPLAHPLVSISRAAASSARSPRAGIRLLHRMAPAAAGARAEGCA